MWKYSGRIIRAGKAWIDNDQVQHPANWASAWDAAYKASIGLVWEDDVDTSFDSRFYWSAGVPKSLDDVNEVDADGNPVMQDGEQVVTKGLKTQAIELVKRQANDKLAVTDWMVVKAAEVADYSVPTETLTARAAIRTASNTIEAAITGAADHAAFMALYDVPVNADGDPTDDPAPINAWPDAE
jgi:hypothetical protein